MQFHLSRSICPCGCKLGVGEGDQSDDPADRLDGELHVVVGLGGAASSVAGGDTVNEVNFVIPSSALNILTIIYDTSKCVSLLRVEMFADE